MADTKKVTSYVCTVTEEQAEALRLEAEGYRMAVAEGLRSFGVNPLPADPQEALLRIQAYGRTEDGAAEAGDRQEEQP